MCYNNIIERRWKKGGQENRQTDKSGSSTYTACLRNRNTHRRHKNDSRKRSVTLRGGNPPPYKIISYVQPFNNMKKSVIHLLHLIISIFWLIIIVIGLFILFT